MRRGTPDQCGVTGRHFCAALGQRRAFLCVFARRFLATLPVGTSHGPHSEYPDDHKERAEYQTRPILIMRGRPNDRDHTDQRKGSPEPKLPEHAASRLHRPNVRGFDGPE
jgi:hypothetical protein